MNKFLNLMKKNPHNFRSNIYRTKRWNSNVLQIILKHKYEYEYQLNGGGFFFGLS